jgi:hypothetical protein
MKGRMIQNDYQLMGGRKLGNVGIIVDDARQRIIKQSRKLKKSESREKNEIVD